MSLKIVGNLKDGVAGLLTGTNLNNVTNLYGAFERAIAIVSQKIKLPDAYGRQSMTLYDGVYDYLAPTTIFGGSLIDLRPQGSSRTPMDAVYKKPIAVFDETKALLPNGVMTTFEWKKGVPIARIVNTRARHKIVLDPMNDTTGWTVGGTASALAADQTVFYNSPASLRFNLTGAGAGYIEKTFSYSLDISEYNGVGVQFIAIKTPSSTDLSSLEIRLGSDSSNYVTLTKTEGFLGAFTTDDFMMIAFDLSQVTTVGTPDFTKIKYCRITVNHTASLTNFYAGANFVSLPSPYEMIYGSAAIFMVNDVLSNTITDDNDQIVLNVSAYSIYELECALAVAFQNGGTLASGIIATIHQQLHGVRARNGAIIELGLYDLYRANNPSEELRSSGNWY